MTSDERDRKLTLKRCWDDFKRHINAKDLVDRLSDVMPGISAQTIHKIKSQDTAHELAAELLMECLLLSKGTGWFDVLLQALVEISDNNLIYRLLLQEYKSIVNKRG